jgi:hypothetical protein
LARIDFSGLQRENQSKVVQKEPGGHTPNRSRVPAGMGAAMVGMAEVKVMARKAERKVMFGRILNDYEKGVSMFDME